ncbi:MAG: FRG domain-containing protein [Terriglobales bacterium]
MQDIRVTTWAELNRELFENTWNESIRRFRSDHIYRGMGDARADLRTGLMKLGGSIREVEFHMLRNFKKYAGENAVRDQSQWNWLAVAQHHGVPTRLLDWSYSPYVALHFATVELDRYERDGMIWAVNYVAVHRLLPKALREVLQEERSNAFTVEMLDRAAPSLGALEKLSKEDFAVFLEPPSLDQRIVNQFSIFSMMSSPLARVDEWLVKEHSDLLRRIIIPAELKWEVRDKLDQANITERVLFPGLDGLARWLQRHYTPRT